MKYLVGRSNLSCTIFVPWDCNNNCPFCTSKHMYSELKDKFNLDEIIRKIKLINNNSNIREYVLTGGEPLSNLENLKKIVQDKLLRPTKYFIIKSNKYNNHYVVYQMHLLQTLLIFQNLFL